ncbi:MAG TPA: alpha/beta fold hydrolase [Candidatus Saccharimonadales bacterium]|nr:alpha/beta fold hydrolase [Candidatus Saccharimonadales bacterium]
MILRSDNVDLFYELRGEGPEVVLLHPFPSDHNFWFPMAQHLESRFRLVLPDLRGLGRSGLSESATTMAKLADDVLRLCDELKIGRAVFVGCSVGGYTLFEFWRRSRDRVKALILMDTKAGADSEEGRTGRLKNAEETLQKGPSWAIEQIMPKLLAPVTMNSRLDVVEAAKKTMSQSGAQGMASLQRGMAVRSDSTELLAQIDVPTLVLGGEDDMATPVSELERIARGIRGAELKIVSKAGHFAAFEQPADVGRIVREFLEKNGR